MATTDKPFPVQVLLRPLLVSGRMATDPEGRVLLMVDTEQDAQQQATAIFHETLHLLRKAAGHPDSAHDEQVIDAMAQRLAAACPDIVEFVTPPARPIA